MHPIHLIFWGWLTSRFGFSLLRMMPTPDFIILPVFFLLSITLFFLAYQLFHSFRLVPYSYFFVGMIADALPFWVLRYQQGEMGLSPWNIWIFTYSLFMLLISIIFYRAINKIAVTVHWPWNRRDKSLSTIHWIYAGGLTIFVCIIYRISYARNYHIPNEERSLFIMDYEIHHAVLGSVFFMLYLLAQSAGLIKNRVLALLLLSLIAGFVLDQVLYIPLRECTDAAYGQMVSVIGAIVGCGGFAGMCFYFGWRLYRSKRKP